MTALAPSRLLCPCCRRDIGTGRAAIRLMPHRVSRDPSRNRPCPGSRLPVALLPAVAELEAAARVALVIPADTEVPVHTVAWFTDEAVLDTAVAAIGAGDVDTTYSETQHTLVACWFDAHGAVAPDRIRNPRYEQLENELDGGSDSTMWGTVVITGDVDDQGDTLGLTRELLDELLLTIGAAA